LVTQGVKPARFWPIVLISAALAESAMAPPGNSGSVSPPAAAGTRSAPAQTASAFSPRNASSDLHGPRALGEGNRDKDRNETKRPNREVPEEPTLPTVFVPTPQTNIIPAVGPDSPIIDWPHGSGGVVFDFPTGGGGDPNLHDVVPQSSWQETIGGGGFDGGGGAGGAGGGGAGGGGGLNPTPIVYEPGTAQVSVPEPVGLPTILGAIGLLARRGRRTGSGTKLRPRLGPALPSRQCLDK
jgi:hypothetical protein